MFTYALSIYLLDYLDDLTEYDSYALVALQDSSVLGQGYGSFSPAEDETTTKNVRVLSSNVDITIPPSSTINKVEVWTIDETNDRQEKICDIAVSPAVSLPSGGTFRIRSGLTKLSLTV